MNAFTGFAFSTTGVPVLPPATSPPTRTQPDRLSDIFNVKDYGAQGDGVTDDWSSIMACFNHNRYFRTAAASNVDATFTGTISSVPSFQGSISGNVLTAAATGALTLGQLTISSYSYNPTNGLLTLNMGSSVSFGAGVSIWVSGLNIIGCNGQNTSVSASGTTVTCNVATGLAGTATGTGTLIVGGQFAVGQTVNFVVGGTPTTDTIASFGSGSGAGGTYNLTNSHGTVASQTMSTNCVLTASGVTGSIVAPDTVLNNGGTDLSPSRINFNTQIVSGSGPYVLNSSQNWPSQAMMTATNVITLTTSANGAPSQLAFDMNNATFCGNGISPTGPSPFSFFNGISQLAFPPGITITITSGISGIVNAGDTIGINLSNSRGIIFFPPGTYNVSKPIDFSTGNGFFLGELGASTVTANFGDYTFVQDGTLSNFGTIEKINIINTHPVGGGIRFGGIEPGAVRDCVITANKGINDYNNDANNAGGFFGSFEFTIENCTLSPGANFTGSQGIMRQSDGPIVNCSITGFDTAGIQVGGGEGCQVIIGCFIEGCTNGVVLDETPLGASFSASGNVIAGCWFKNCSIAINVPASAGTASIMGVYIEGTNGQAPGGGNPTGANPQYGILSASPGSGSGFLGQSLIAGVTVVGQFDVAGIYMNGRNFPISGPTFMGVADQSTCPHPFFFDPSNSGLYLPTQIACNARHIYTVAQLPGPTDNSQELNVSDATNGLAWGATVTNTGTHTTPNLVQWNGSNWTVMGQ